MLLNEKDYKWNFIVNSGDIVFFHLGMTFGSIFTFLPLFAKKLGAGNLVIGFIPAIINLGWGIPAIIGAKYSEKHSKKLDMVLKFTLGERVPYFFIALIAFFIVPYSPALSLIMCFLMLAIISSTMGILGPPWVSMIGNVIHPLKRGKFFAMGNGIGAIMSIGGAVIARYFLGNYAFPNNFGFCFLIAGFAFMISYYFLKLTREKPVKVKRTDIRFLQYLKGTFEVLKDKNYKNYITNRILVSSADMSGYFIIIYDINKFSISDKVSAEFTGFLLASQGISSFLFGYISDRFGHKSTLILGRIFLILSFLLLLFAKSLILIYLVYILWGITMSSFMIGDLSLTLELAPLRKRDMYIGVLNFLIAPPAFLGPIIGGKIADWFGFKTLFFVSFILSSLSLILLIKKVHVSKKIKGVYYGSEHI